MPVALYPIRRDMMFYDATNFNVYCAGLVVMMQILKLTILSQSREVGQTKSVIFGVCVLNAIVGSTRKLNKLKSNTQHIAPPDRGPLGSSG